MDKSNKIYKICTLKTTKQCSEKNSKDLRKWRDTVSWIRN